MIVDAGLPPTDLKAIPSLARAAEAMGFGAVWSAETMHDPFLPGALVAEHTQRVHFGTAVAIAFARSPATMAYTAWDLSQASGGRFILGLGTQVKAHIERRFGLPWPESPVKKLREQVQAVQAFWKTWQDGEPLRYRGEYYRLSLMSPFFNPGPIRHPHIPIFISGVNTGLAHLGGEVADGFHVHPFHTPRYLQEVLLPAFQEGLAAAGRSRSAFQVSAHVFTATNEAEREFVRQQISFYASTPSYRKVMALHGWEEPAERLSALASQGQWGEMAALVSDEMLQTFAVVADPAGAPQAVVERYQGLADRLTLYIPFTPGDRDEFWKALLRQAEAGSSQDG